MSFPKFWERDEKTQENVSLCESGVLTAVFHLEGGSPGISPP